MQQLPDVPPILVDQLVHHGMEHDDKSIRLWSTLVSSRLLVGVVDGAGDYTTMFDFLLLSLVRASMPAPVGVPDQSALFSIFQYLLDTARTSSRIEGRGRSNNEEYSKQCMNVCAFATAAEPCF